MKITIIFLFILVVLFLIIVYLNNTDTREEIKLSLRDPARGPDFSDDFEEQSGVTYLTSDEKVKYNFYYGGDECELKEYFDSQENLLLFGACKYTGTSWGYSHHNKALKEWIELAEQYTTDDIKIKYSNVMCCTSGLKNNDFRPLNIRYYQLGEEVEKYEGDFSKESMGEFILECLNI